MLSAILISLAIALIIGGLAGLLLADWDERGFGTFAGLAVGFNIWAFVWVVVIIVHFVAKFW